VTCSSWFLARGFLYPEDGGDMLHRNVGSHKIYTAPRPRRRHSSTVFVVRHGYLHVRYRENLDSHIFTVTFRTSFVAMATVRIDLLAVVLCFLVGERWGAASDLVFTTMYVTAKSKILPRICSCTYLKYRAWRTDRQTDTVNSTPRWAKYSCKFTPLTAFLSFIHDCF
jgi:hypothetical protein